MIRFTKAQVEAGEHERLDPAHFDFRWNADFSECEASPLLWWDDASYARHRGDWVGDAVRDSIARDCEEGALAAEAEAHAEAKAAAEGAWPESGDDQEIPF